MKQDHFYCGQFYAHNQNLQTEAQVLSNFYSGQFYVHNQNLQTEDQILSNFYPGQFYVHNQKKQTEAQILSPALYIDLFMIFEYAFISRSYIIVLRTICVRKFFLLVCLKEKAKK